MAAQPDLWGDLGVAPLRTPLAILKEQAVLLGHKTNNVLEAEVGTSTQMGTFIHEFSLVVPTLDNYTYQLFLISHPVELYPVFIRYGGPSLKNETEFIEWLRAKLSSPETKRIISSLLAQATS